jgi:outer membrane protein TolC
LRSRTISRRCAREQQREAEGIRQQSLAGLLPNISGQAYQANLTQNLAALGFRPGTFGLRSTFIGPFNNFDARLRLAQNIFDLSAIRRFQAGRAGVELAGLREELAREQVATVTALAYLEALRAERGVAAAEANVELARALLQLAEDQHKAGVATGVDVTRAETRLAEEQLRLAQAQTAAEQARLNLKRIIGVPLEASFVLTDQLRFVREPLPSLDEALAQAAQNRREILLAEGQVRLSALERQAASAEQLPSVAFVGDYGTSGITPTDTALPTRRVAIQLNVPIFNGGLTRGRVAAAASRQRQAELELDSIRRQVEEDVRLAFANLRTAEAQVRAADESVRLAERELEMARDRFQAGVGDNLEVVNAQTALANAREAQITALAVYNAARLNLASALGRAEKFRW